jgi:hypothetical protein
VTSIDVTSPISSRIAVGRGAQFQAVARDAQGAAVPGAAISWSTSAAGVASVTAVGVVSGNAAGTATITATSGSVNGQLPVTVIAADLAGINVALTDAAFLSFTDVLGTAVGTPLKAAIAKCHLGTTDGNITLVETCLTEARAQIAAGSDASDRAILATLALYFDHIERLLND